MALFSSKPKFNPDEEVPDLSGKVILVTGGTAGLGFESILQLIRHNPDAIFFTGRNASSAAKVISSAREANPNVDVKFLECDFTSLQTVRAAAESFLASAPRLDILMCNAGIMAVPAALTKDGYQIQFGTNHMAHALLVKLLLPIMQKTAAGGDKDVRIVLNTSLGYKLAPKGGIVFDKLKTDGSNFGTGSDWTCYGQSKLANVLHCVELARRYPDIKAVVIHPGVVNTGLVSDLPFVKRFIVWITTPGGLLTPQEGAHNQVWAATMPDVKTGAYYEPVGKLGARSEYSNDTKLAQRLWDWTESELDAYSN